MERDFSKLTSFEMLYRMKQLLDEKRMVEEEISQIEKEFKGRDEELKKFREFEQMEEEETQKHIIDGEDWWENPKPVV